jgi:hypothetical protein
MVNSTDTIFEIVSATTVTGTYSVQQLQQQKVNYTAKLAKIDAQYTADKAKVQGKIDSIDSLLAQAVALGITISGTTTSGN